MKNVHQFLIWNFVTLFLTHSAFAQSGSVYSKPIDLPKAYQETVTKYEAFEKAHGHYIQTPNVNMHYLTWSKPKGMPFVWVHGTGSNGYEIASIADSVINKGQYVIAIDYYGHGKTIFLIKEVSLYHVADDIHSLLVKLNIKKTIIGGWSKGGSISTAFYDAYPEMVAGIVLEDGGSVGWTRPFYKMEHQEMMKKLNDESKEYGPILPQEMFSSSFDAFCKHQSNGKLSLGVFHSINKSLAGEWATNPGLDKWLKEDSWESVNEAMVRPTEAPFFQYSTMMIEPKIALRNLQVPLLIYDPIDGTDVFKDFENENRLLTQQHPEWITHLVYENTGHAVKYQHPERFYKDLISFLDKERRTNSKLPTQKTNLFPKK